MRFKIFKEMREIMNKLRQTNRQSCNSLGNSCIQANKELNSDWRVAYAR